MTWGNKTAHDQAATKDATERTYREHNQSQCETLSEADILIEKLSCADPPFDYIWLHKTVTTLIYSEGNE